MTSGSGEQNGTVAPLFELRNICALRKVSMSYFEKPFELEMQNEAI